MTNKNTQATERRSEYRLANEYTVFVETPPMEGSPNDQAKLLISKTIDISANGIQVIFDYPLAENSIHRLCIQTNDGLRFTLIGEVMRILKKDGHTLAGFKLLESTQTDIALWKRYIAKRLLEEASGSV